MHKKVVFLAAVVLAAMASFLTLTGCGSDASQARDASVDLSALAQTIPLDGEPVEVAGITFAPPSAWTDRGASGMRNADYVYGPVGDDSDSATAAVFFFGARMGGDVEANFTRWLGQMVMPDGTDPAENTLRRTTMVDGMKVYLMELSGTFLASAGPMMGGPKTPLEGYFMSTAVVEGPDGNVFFKLTGPETTAREMNEGFLAMIGGVRKTSSI